MVGWDREVGALVIVHRLDPLRLWESSGQVLSLCCTASRVAVSIRGARVFGRAPQCQCTVHVPYIFYRMPNFLFQTRANRLQGYDTSPACFMGSLANTPKHQLITLPTLFPSPASFAQVKARRVYLPAS